MEKDVFVVDVYLNLTTKEIKVIELNPLETSNWFMFHPFKDKNLILNGPFELRLP
jgi:hypothetical protein